MNKQTTVGIMAVCILIADHGYSQSAPTASSGGASVMAADVSIGGGNGAGTSLQTTSNTNGTKTVYRDAMGSIELNTVGGQKSVVVKNPDGATTFSGPFNTEAERAAAPVLVRSSVEKIEAVLAKQTQTIFIRKEELRQSSAGGAGGGGSSVKMVRVDQNGQVEISDANGHQTVLIKNPDGTEIFSGASNTDAARGSAPVPVRLDGGGGGGGASVPTRVQTP